MAKSTVRQKEFGSDHGLIHQAVVTGRKVGAGEDFWKVLAEDEATFRRVVQLVQGEGVPTGWLTPEEAAKIMGRNFHPVDSAGFRFGFRLNARDRRTLLNVPFSADILQACKDTHVLVPILPLSLVQVHERAAGEFWPGQKEDPWFADRDQEFAQLKPQASWHLIRKDEVPGSTSARWSEQLQILRDDEFVPKVNLVTQAAVLHYLETGEKLFSRVWVRTDDVTASGYRVCISFNADGFYVNGWGDYAYGSIGVSATRKSN